ncbi:putative Polycomb group protein ASXL2 isoform X2 [Carcharodon carcharias]|uniref:putative Polycomb group protein ASXL2 isoform X2 n=1 Tax=Carcharodon carcharias TaxID=13397 RepID=UPI001B7EDCA7|nr:putative Polycomb group protein ASXL2 isoform X2 [Carcharodon carcharias]XP_041043611.1 putative Polycomb group protein ASXL2 isoform X2 [Carcharodon carcharias]
MLHDMNRTGFIHVLEKYPNTPMSHKEILQVIQREGLKEISGTSPLACLNAMLHTNSRGEEGIFYKVPGRMGVYTLKKDVPDEMKELSEMWDDSSDAHSDSQSTESNEKRERKRISSRLSSQPASPQSSCPSPSIPQNKIMSPSQKHSKKALKQALKQQQQRKQCRPGLPVSSNPRLLLKSVKATDQTASKTGWEMKQSDGCSTSPQNSTCSSSSSGKMEQTLPGLGRKPCQRSERLNARQLKRTKATDIDVETPDSILVNTNLRALINKHTFSVFPGDFQQRLLLLLPEVDRQVGTDGLMRLSTSALNNEFFTSAAQGWKERLSEGEFTPEMQLRIRQEIEKEKKVEQWKESFFENYYGQNSGISLEDSEKLTALSNNVEDCQRPPSKQALLQSVMQETSIKAETPVEPKGETDHKAITKEAGMLKVEEKVEDTEKSAASSEQCGTKPIPAIKNHEDNRSSEISALPEKKVDLDHITSVLQQDNQTSKVGSIISPEAKALVPKPKLDQNEPKLQLKSESSETSKSKKPEAFESVESKSHESSKQDQVLNSTEQMEVTAEGLKRKSTNEGESLLSPEKRPRIVDHQLFRTPPKDFPRNKDEPHELKVPPLKISVSRIRPVPTQTGQVSPRATFPPLVTSPGRTGARTLADIKAKAQLAKAQRAAAAAAAGGAVPGPGPGGGSGGGGGTGTGISRISGQGSTLDMDRTGGRRGIGGPLFNSPGQQPRKCAEATAKAPTSMDARTQLQQAPMAQCIPAGSSTDPSKSTTTVTTPALTLSSVHTTTSVTSLASLQTTPVMTNSAATKATPAPMQTQTIKQISSPTVREVLKPVPVFSDSEYAKAATQSSGNFAMHNKPGEVSNQPLIDSNVRASNVDRKLPADTSLPCISFDTQRGHQVSASANVFVTTAGSISVASGGTAGTLEVASPVSETSTNVESPIIISTTSAPLFCTSLDVPSLKTQGPVCGTIPKMGSSIPANNPLVTQLLQGKEVPLEQFLPKPLTKVEMKPVYQFPKTSLDDNMKISSDGTLVVSVTVGNATTVIHGSGEVSTDLIKGRQSETVPEQVVESTDQHRQQKLFEQASKHSSTNEEQQIRDTDQDCSQPETLNSTTQERIQQAILSNVQSQILVPVSLQHEVNSSAFSSAGASVGQRSRFGLMGTKSALKPAVSGHYLLNTATYGRGSESWKRAHVQSTETHVGINGLVETSEKDLKEDRAKQVDGSVQVTSESNNRSVSCHPPSVLIKTEQDPTQMGDVCPRVDNLSSGYLKVEAPTHEYKHTGKENTPLLPPAHVAGISVTKEFYQGIQSNLAHVGGGKSMQSHQDPYRISSLSVGFQQPTQHQQKFPPYGGNRASSQFAFRPVHSSSINVPSVSSVNHCSTVTGMSVYSQVSNNSGNMVSFSVTVTTLPAGQSINTSSQSAQTFPEGGNMEDSPSKCYCRLKAMIMCKGCGAFCHDDCIGPSKLCVSCLVVR